MSLIIAAAKLAHELHKGQIRKYTNRPYIEHPIRVAGRLATMSCADEISVAAAFLHDVIEDCDVTKERLIDLLSGVGSTSSPCCIASYVQMLTNPSKGSSLNRAARKEMDREHLRNAPKMIKIIKLIDRIDNLNEMSNADIGFIRKYCEESKLLADAIGDADSSLYHELCDRIEYLLLVNTAR